MGSEGSIGSIRSAGSGQSTEGTNGQSTNILIENTRVGASPRSPLCFSPRSAPGWLGLEMEPQHLPCHPLHLLAKGRLQELSILHQSHIHCWDSVGRCSWEVPGGCPPQHSWPF